jgi:hypothetical protein
MALFSPKQPDPHGDRVTLLATEFNALRAADSERLQRMRDYRDEIEASRKTGYVPQSASGDYGRGKRADGEPERHRFHLPFGQALTIKHSFRIAGRLPDAQVDRRAETPEERHRSDAMEKAWWGVVRASKGDVVIGSAAHDASGLGAACLEVYWDAARQMPRFRDIDPAGVVVVKGLDDPHDFERVYRFWEVDFATLAAQYRDQFVDEDKTRPVSFEGFKVSPGGKVTVVQMSDRQRTVRFALGYAEGQQRPVDAPLMDYEHGYGFAPYVVVTNLGPQRNVWGWADYDFVREIAAYIPTMFGREADILRMVANGAYKMKGSKLTPAAAKNILQKGGVVPVGKDGDLEPVEAAQVPAFASEHRQSAVEFFQMLGFAPPAAWGDGSAGSGSDRGLQLGPMLELTMMKQLNFGAGLSRLGAMCFRMMEKLQAGKASYSGSVQRRGGRTGFTAVFGPGLQDDQGMSMDLTELIAKEYDIRFSWPSRLDPDDPAFVASELNKFAQGAQSLRTTLERLGHEAPEDEMKLIEQESQDHPWLRQGMLKLLEMQLNASNQGANDGSQNQGADFGSALATMNSKDGQALDGDAMSGQLPGGIGTLYGGA